MPPEGGRGAAWTPLGVKWVNVPSGDERAKPSGRPVFFERPPRKEKGAQRSSPKGPESEVTDSPTIGIF